MGEEAASCYTSMILLQAMLLHVCKLPYILLLTAAFNLIKTLNMTRRNEDIYSLEGLWLVFLQTF